MNCHHCGAIMIFREFSDYGGYSCGWKCIFCGEIIDQVPENRRWREEGGNENKNGRRRYPKICNEGVKQT